MSCTFFDTMLQERPHANFDANVTSFFIASVCWTKKLFYQNTMFYLGVYNTCEKLKLFVPLDRLVKVKKS